VTTIIMVTSALKVIKRNALNKSMFYLLTYLVTLHNACATFNRRLLSVDNPTVSAVSRYRFLSFYHFLWTCVSALNNFDLI